MNLFRHFQEAVVEAVEALVAEGKLPDGLDTGRISVEPPRDATHGDVASNAAMVLAGPAGIRPRALAEMLQTRLAALKDVSDVAIAGPGFLNLRLSDGFWQARLAEILDCGVAYGNSTLGAGEAVNVEYVSANPTGPMHVGHGRGAVVGDALAALLEKAGYRVTREYYVNDAGGQVDGARTLAAATLSGRGRREGRGGFRQPEKRGRHRVRRRIPAPSGRGPGGARRRALGGRAGERLAAGFPRLRHRRDAGSDPRRSGGDRHPLRCGPLGARTGRAGPGRRGDRLPCATRT